MRFQLTEQLKDLMKSVVVFYYKLLPEHNTFYWEVGKEEALMTSLVV